MGDMRGGKSKEGTHLVYLVLEAKVGALTFTAREVPSNWCQVCLFHGIIEVDIIHDTVAPYCRRCGSSGGCVVQVGG